MEGLISIVASGASSYLPGGTLNTLAAGGNDQLSWGPALGLAILYGAIAATVTFLAFRNRDITSWSRIVLTLFTPWARVNASAFVVGWARAAASGVAYLVADAADAAIEMTAPDTVSWVLIGAGNIS